MPLILDSIEERKYTLLQFTLKSGELRSEPVWWGPENPPNLGLVTVLGVKTPVSGVTINQIAQAFRYDTIHKVSNYCEIFCNKQIYFIFYFQYLLIDNLNISLKSPVIISWK